jgi:predicted acylesterase/phospholipase RssA
MIEEQQAPLEDTAVVPEAEAVEPEGPHSEWQPAYNSWSQVVARYRSQHARGEESDTYESYGDRTRLATPRTIGAASHIFILTRLQLMVAAVLGAGLLDFLIEGSMREALRYAVVDAPQQFPAIIVALLLACAALRFSAEAMIELVSPELYDAQGNIRILAHLLPRFLAIFVGFAAGFPLLKLAADSDIEVLGSLDNRMFAAIFGAIFVAVGLLVGIVGKGPHSRGRGTLTRRSSILLRATLALLPLAAIVALAGTLWGIFPGDEPSHYLGIPHGALARYLALDTEHVVLQAAIEALAIFLTAIFARLALNVVIYLLAPNAMGSRGIVGIIAAWLPRIAAALIGFVLTVRVIGLYGVPSLSQTSGYWLLGIALGYSVMALLAALADGSFAVVTDSSTIFQRTGSRWLMGAERMAALDPSWRRFFALLLIGAVGIFFVFFDVSKVTHAQTIGPIAIVLLWGFAAVALFFPVAYMSHATKMPLMLILLIAGVAFAGFDINDNHQLRGAGTAIPTVDAALAASAQTAPTYYRETVDLGDWIASRRDWQQYEHYPIFLVATEGGGIRAAYFTASVLAALQEKCPAFAQHTLAISSVSGGSVGAAVFAGEAADQLSNVRGVGCNLGAIESGVLVERARNVLATDLLSPLLGAALFPDALQRILPLPIEEFDRARALEFALEDSWRRNTPPCRTCDPNRMSSKVEAMYPREEVRRPVPHLFLNTTEAGTGLSKPFATWDIGELALPERHRTKREANALPVPRLVPLQDRIATDSVPLSAAAMVSARFPYLTPAARVGDAGHYVDGGYFENSGTWLVGGVAQNLIGQRLNYRNEQNKDLERAVRNSVIVAIVIRSSPCNPCGAQGTDTRSEDLDATWNEALSPVRALLYARDKRAEYSITDLGAMTSLIQRLAFRRERMERGEAMAKVEEPPATAAERAPVASECMNTICAVTVTFHNKSTAEVPLSWVLSSRARHAMDEAVDQILSEDLQKPVPPPNEVDDVNRLEGSYRRIMCLLQNDSKSIGCATAIEAAE